MDIFKRENWDRRRTKYINKDLFIIVDGYKSGKMMEGII